MSVAAAQQSSTAASISLNISNISDASKLNLEQVERVEEEAQGISVRSKALAAMGLAFG